MSVHYVLGLFFRDLRCKHPVSLGLYPIGGKIQRPTSFRVAKSNLQLDGVNT